MDIVFYSYWIDFLALQNLHIILEEILTFQILNKF
jgi:hypothetical protein